MFKVLHASGEDAREWDATIATLPYDLRDIHFTSGWARAHERDGAEGRLAVWQNDWFTIVQPFMLRPIYSERSRSTGRFDMTAEGYGGPASNASLLSLDDRYEFDEQMDAWRRQNRVVSEFYLVNPVTFRDQLPLLELQAEYPLRRERWVTLLPTYGDLRPDPNRAGPLKQAAGAVIQRETNPAAFAHDYQAAMDRFGAAPRWRLTAADFERIVGALGDKAHILSASEFPGRQDQVRARAIFLMGTGATAYYYLAARPTDRSGGGYPDQLIEAARKQAAFLGAAYLHLGGGLKDGDNLDRYKASFGGLRRPVYSVRRVFDTPAYVNLAAGRITPFFPAYRAMEASK